MYSCCTDKRSKMWLATIAAFALLWWIAPQWMEKPPPPINGIYSQNGPWYRVKYWSFCLLLVLQKLAKRAKRDLKCLDQTQTFSLEQQEHHGNDSIFFIGSCTKTGLTFIVATERRPNNITYGLVYVMVKKCPCCDASRCFSFNMGFDFRHPRVICGEAIGFHIPA